MLKDAFAAWRDQVTDSLGRQDIQAAWVLTKRFIIKIEPGYGQVRVRYRYPLDASLNGQR